MAGGETKKGRKTKQKNKLTQNQLAYKEKGERQTNDDDEDKNKRQARLIRASTLTLVGSEQSVSKVYNTIQKEVR